MGGKLHSKKNGGPGSLRCRNNSSRIRKRKYRSQEGWRDEEILKIERTTQGVTERGEKPSFLDFGESGRKRKMDPTSRASLPKNQKEEKGQKTRVGHQRNDPSGILSS